MTAKEYQEYIKNAPKKGKKHGKVERSPYKQYKDIGKVKQSLRTPENKPLVVGIDTGKKTGFAVWDSINQKFALIQTMKIHQAMAWIAEHYAGIGLVIVEDARKARFGRNTYQDRHKAQGAGSVKRDAAIWEDFLEDLSINYCMIRPSKKLSKLNADQFRKITGYTGRTSEHARDAGMLVFKSK